MIPVCAFFNILGASIPLMTQTVPCTAIKTLCSQRPPEQPVWIKGTILEQKEEDTFIIADSSGAMILFLPTDELLDLGLSPGMHLAIFGVVDKNPVSSKRNEFCAEKIFSLDN